MVAFITQGSTTGVHCVLVCGREIARHPPPLGHGMVGVAAHPENLPGPHIKRQTIVATALRCEAELAGLSDLRDRPAGTIRISADEHAASIVLWPALERFLPNYPDIKAEIVVDNGLGSRQDWRHGV